MLSREQFIEIVENQYFGNMAAARPERILALLSEDAVLTGFSGSAPPRIVRRHPGPEEESFDHFLGALHADFTLAYSQFVHFVDVPEQCCACTFRLEVRARDPSSPMQRRVLRNSNFFRFRHGLIHAVIAYFSMPPVEVDPWATAAHTAKPVAEPGPHRSHRSRPS